MSQQKRSFFNATLDKDDIPVTNYTEPNATTITDLGLLVSTSSECKVYGVKSDRGTTDGYLALPLTTQSTEFYIAAWPSVHRFHVFSFFLAARCYA